VNKIVQHLFFSTEQDIELFSVPLTVAFWIALVLGGGLLLAVPGVIVKAFFVAVKLFSHYTGLKEDTDVPQIMSESVWLIHGKLYDLNSWAAHHPGGAHALDLGRNRDCTGLFESYHVFLDRDVLEKMLQRFEIKPDRVHSSSAYLKATLSMTDFACPFHEDVKKFARQHFKDKSHKMKPWWACMLSIIFILEIAATVFHLKGSLAALWLLPLLSWLLAGNLSHDGSHFAVSSHPWLNKLVCNSALPLFFGPTAWYIQHVVQHHLYTNTEDDVDLYHFLPVVRTTRLTKFKERFKYQVCLGFLLMPTATAHLLFVGPLELLSGATDARGVKRYEQCQNLGDFVARKRCDILAEFLVMSLWVAANIYAHGMWVGWGRMIVSWTVSSYLFLILTQGAHLHRDCQEHHDQSWAKRQVNSAIAFQPESYLWLFLSGGLNMQSLHHVLPGVASCHYRDMWPGFRAVCEKHGVHLKETSNVFHFFRGFLSWVHELSSET